MTRTVAMAIFFCILKGRCLRAKPLAWVSCSATVLVAVSPQLWGEPGFFLSVAGTFLLFQASASASGKGWLATAVVLPLSLPLLMIPWSAFYFSKVSWLAPVAESIVGVVWSLVFLPAGFVLPVLFWALPSVVATPLGHALEKFGTNVDAQFATWLPHVRGAYVTTLRPTWFEALAGEVLLVFALSALIASARQVGAPR